MTSGRNSPIYDDLMRFKPDGLTPNAWAVAAGVSRTVWADMRRHGNPSRRTLDKLLTAAGSSLAEFEALRIHGPAEAETVSSGLADRGGRDWGGQPLPALPVLATVMAGEWGDATRRIELTELGLDEIVDRAARPASLANDASAYAITIVGNSMWPRFRPGRRVAVSARAPVAVGDDVLVRLKDADERRSGAVPVLIKELVSKTGGGVALRQFNPDVTFDVDADEIEAIEKVLGELV